jgi:tRNA pseudouridine38-40 synthase
MAHFRVTLAYDGTDFEGFQAQARGRTVQGVLETALATLHDDRSVRIAGAGRTDAGVHALGQVVCFHLDRDLDPSELLRALNGLLPADVRARAVAAADPGFHARRSAVSKHYRYELDTGPLQLPTRRRYAGHAPYALDRGRVVAAAGLFLGRHDFASLASAGGSVKTTVRTVTRSEVRFALETLIYEVEADGFLRKMVRSMVGGLIAAGRGVLSVDALAEALRTRDRRTWPAPAEARGLTLVSIDYGDEPKSGVPGRGPVLG